jgi:uncharacterized OsmC-like protein
LTAEVRGEIETENHVLVIRRIHVIYYLVADEKDLATIERVHKLHARNCPIYLSLHRAIEITTEYQLVEAS